MRVGIYARVSTEGQQARGTIESQLAVLRERVHAEGEELVAEFCDDGHSGARLDRPGLDALRDAAEAGLIEAVWCLSPDRLARAYAYQVVVLDELARHGVAMRFTDTPPLDDDPQAKLLTQVQGMIAEYERAKINERYRRGKLFRSRTGEVLSWKAPYGYRRLPRDAQAPGRLEIYEPEATVVRRIFDDYVAGGHSIRQITRRLNTDSVPSPTGKPTWGTSTLGRILRNEAYVGRVFFNRTEVVPDPQSKRKARQVPRAREEWIPIAVPALVDEHTFEAATRISRDNTQWSPRRAEPGYWLLRGLVKCGVCQVGANCHKMRGRNGTWHRYYYCRNHDPLRAGGEDRRCPERNIRADILDEFVFDEVRAALTRPETLLAGEQALAVRTPAPDDELLAAELARLDRKLDAAEAERRRLIDLYQAGLVDLTDMQRRAADVEARRRHLTERRDSLATEREQLTRDNQLRRRVTDFARRAVAAFDHLDFEQKQTLLRLIIDEVQVTGWHVQIRLRIPLDDNPGEPQPPNPPHTDGDNSPELSIEDRLRSLGGPQRRLLPAQKPRPRPRPHRPSRHQLTPELVKIQLPKPDQISVAVDNDIAVAEIDLLASRDDLVIIGEAKTTPGLGTRKQRVSKAKKLATVARVLHADQILLCTSATDNWPEIDVKAVQDAVRSKFADAADQPRIRIITGLGTTGVNDLII